MNTNPGHEQNKILRIHILLSVLLESGWLLRNHSLLRGKHEICRIIGIMGNLYIKISLWVNKMLNRISLLKVWFKRGVVKIEFVESVEASAKLSFKYLQNLKSKQPLRVFLINILKSKIKATSAILSYRYLHNWKSKQPLGEFLLNI